MSNATAILERLVKLCDELEILPGGAARWIREDLIESAQIDSMALVQLSALVEDEFGVAISREELVSKVRTLQQVAEHIAVARRPLDG